MLSAVPFDSGSMRPTGSPVPVVQGIQAANFVNATMHYAVADNGTLVFVPGQPLPARRWTSSPRIAPAHSSIFICHPPRTKHLEFRLTDGTSR